MKFVHTADVHLHPEYPERLKALRQVCERTQALGANLLVIAGDLFDSASVATNLRPKVRDLFNEFAFNVLIVAGNHDEEAYSEGIIYGGRVTAVSHEGSRAVKYEGISFIGLPFHRGQRANKLLETVTCDSSGANVLVTHASFFTRDSRWANIPLELREEEPNEFAMVQDDVTRRGLAYVALGHWHQPTDPPLEMDDTRVAYSGTPYPVSRAEVGQRKVALVEVEKDSLTQVAFVPLKGIPYNVQRRWFIVMGQEKQTLEKIAAFLDSEQADPLANLRLRIKGYLQSSEQKFQQRLQEVCEQRQKRWRCIEHEFHVARFDITARPAIEQFVEQMQNAKAPGIASTRTDAELRNLARELIDTDLDSLRAEALRYGLQAFQEIQRR